MIPHVYGEEWNEKEICESVLDVTKVLCRNTMPSGDGVDGEKRMSTLGTLQEMLNEMKSGVYDFTKDGECSNCGACCSDFLPMSGGEVKTIRKYIAKHGIKEHKHTPPTIEPVQDFTCPFRNELERKCDIYPVRPAICRDFRCDKPKKEIMANKNMYHGKYSVWEMRETFFGEAE